MDKNSKFLLIYHKEDNDGLFSMAILFNYLTHECNVNIDSIDLFGADYQMMNNASVDKWFKKYTHIMMTDISFNDFKIIKKIYKKYEDKFVWIDHHAPVIKQTYSEKIDKIPGERLIEHSAILNAYKYCYDNFNLEYNDTSSNRMELFKVLSAFDSMTYEENGYEQDYVVNVNTGVCNEFMLKPAKIINYVEKIIYDTDSINIEQEIKRFHNAGETYNRIEDAKHIQMVADYGQEFTINADKNRTAIAIFTIGQTGYNWFSEVADKYQNGIVFKHLKDGNWTISLYNTTNEDKDFHCGDYLKTKYNGGGHLGAAGCQVTEEQFIKILKSKTL